MDKEKIKKILESNKEVIEKLDFYLPTVKKVHGKEHEEIYEVDMIYNSIKKDLSNFDYERLKDRFINLREVTSNYDIPKDTCETYEAVYNMLKKLDNDLMV